MLRRHHSHRMNRKKSASSIKSNYEPMDPEVGRRHAHTAAITAFPKVSPNQQQEQRDGPQLPTTIKRQQSVRFAGPCAVTKSENAIKRAPYVGGETPATHLQPVVMTTNAPVPAAYRPPSRSSSIGKGSISKATANHLVMINDAFDAQYTREDDVASTPSSYRRVRRSKSMFSPGKAPSIFYTNGTPEYDKSQVGRRRSLLSNTRKSLEHDSASVLRAPKSMSFLRDRVDIKRSASNVQQERNDAAVQMARDRFFTQTTQQRLREQPSFLFRAKVQRQERSFRKSVRSSSGGPNYDVPISSVDNDPVKDSGLKSVARKASKSLRLKFKRIFGGSSKDDDPIAIPDQQVFAKETHVRRYLGDLPADNIQYPKVAQSLEPSLWQVNSKVPSLHNVASSQHLRSINGSVRSGRSVKSVATNDSDNKSRVTSWTSTGINTLNSRIGQSHAEKEMQRLSVIKENGTHVSSSSFSRKYLHNQSLPHTKETYRGKENVSPPSQAVHTQVDSARVYSALMKRLDGREGGIDRDTVSRRMEIPEALTRAPSHKRVHKSRSQATIRRVTSADNPTPSLGLASRPHQMEKAQVFPSQPAAEPDYGNHVDLWVASARLPGPTERTFDDIFSAQSSISNKENIPPWTQKSAHSQKSSLSHQASISTLYHKAPEKNVLTPQEMANRNESSGPSHRPLRDSRSTFFGGTSAFPITRTPSPFRRALAETNQSSHSYNDQAYAPKQLSPLRNPLYRSTNSSVSLDGPHEPENTYSESVYSRTTSGLPPAQDVNSPAFDFGEPDPLDPTVGDAIIIGRTTYRPIIPVRKQHQVSGSTGSIEWQKWMSSEVAKLERTREIPATASYINYALPTMPKLHNTGHVRERTSINESDTDMLHTSTGVKVASKTDLPSVRTIPVLRPILKNRSASSLIDPDIGDSRNTSSSDGPPPPPPPPPPPLPIPPSRLPLRQMQSKATVETSHAPHEAITVSAPSSTVKATSVSNRNVLHKRSNSTTTLRNTKSLETSSKLVKQPRQRTSPSPNHGPIVSISLQRDKQFGSSSSRSRSPTRSNNRGNVNSRFERDDVYQSDGTGMMGPDLAVGVCEMSEREAQSLGSKRMVDMFLNSRRKRIASASDEGGARAFI